MRWLLEPLSRNFPNRLVNAEGAGQPRRVACLLVLLVVVSFVPRALMAGKLDLVCPDGILYLELAAAIQRGDVEHGLGALGLNTFPPLLAAWHNVGFDWLTAGELWGVIAGSLVVLPLFGWTRRQFDDRVATLACLLYACHPKLIEWSPELIRDPTFWFLWAASIYASWRAVTAKRFAWFAAAGVSIGLALHTRFEGWFLYVPLFGWAGYRVWRREVSAARMAAGVTLAVAMCPFLLWTVNVTWLRDRPQWELGNFQRLRYVAQWAQATLPNVLAKPQTAASSVTQAEQTTTKIDWTRSEISESDGAAPRSPYDRMLHASGATEGLPDSLSKSTESTAGQASSGTDFHREARIRRAEASAGQESAALRPTAIPIRRPLEPPVKMSTTAAVWTFLHHARRGCGAVFSLWMLIGVCGWFRVWRRGDWQPVFWLAVCVMAGIWVHLWYAQATSSRYWLSIVLLGCPFAGLGLGRVAEWLAGGAQRFGLGLKYAAALSILLSAFGVYGWADALSSGDDHGRRGEAALGRWMAARCDADARLLMPATMPVCRYYTAAGDRTITADSHSYEIADLLVSAQPDVAVCSRGKSRPEVCLAFTEEAARQGLLRIAPEALPAECDADDLIVFVRESRFARIENHRLNR